MTSPIWMLPIGRGRESERICRPRSMRSRAAGRISSLVQIQSGAHLTAFYSSHCGSGTNCYGSEKADAVSGQDPNGGPQTLAQWFNTYAFSIGAFRDAQGRSIFAGRFGDAEKGSIVGPGAWNVDFAAFKDVRLGQARDRTVQRLRDQPLQSSELGTTGDEPHERELRKDHVAVPDLPPEDDRAGGANHLLT